MEEERKRSQGRLKGERQGLVSEPLPGQALARDPHYYLSPPPLNTSTDTLLFRTLSSAAVLIKPGLGWKAIGSPCTNRRQVNKSIPLRKILKEV